LDQKKSYNVHHVVDQFYIQGTLIDVAPHPSGHINDTFLVTFEDDGEKRYIVQLINKEVFKNPEQVMQNIGRIIVHLKKKIVAEGGDPLRETMTLIPTHNDKYFYIDSLGNYWRTYLYIEDTSTYDIVNNATMAYEGGCAFGKFQTLLVDLPGEPLHETIPHFHDIEKRLETFWLTVDRDPVQRVSEIKDEMRFITTREKEIKLLFEKSKEGLIPQRITHNDTKFNNVLIDSQNRGICVIDLDTVMNGIIHFDFGDAVRVISNTAAEDEKDLDKVNLNMEFFEAYTKGYMESGRSYLTDNEVELMAFSCRYMTFMLAVRFLTDHIDGDRYFKVHFPYHNLQRARAQFKLVMAFEENYDRMNDIIHKVFEN